MTYLDLVVLDLHCCPQALHSCGEQAYLWLMGFSCCRAQARGHVDLSSCGMQASWLQLSGSRVQAHQ